MCPRRRGSEGVRGLAVSTEPKCDRVRHGPEQPGRSERRNETITRKN